MGSVEALSQIEFTNFPPEDIKIHASMRKSKTLNVDELMTAAKACEHMAQKNKLKESSADYAIIEQLVTLGLERSLEDHEEILPIYKSWTTSISDDQDRLCFRKDIFKKYDYMKNKKHFPLSMVAFVDEQGNYVKASSDKEKQSQLQTMLKTTCYAPIAYGHMYAKLEKAGKWEKKYFVLKNNTLYYSTTCPEADATDIDSMNVLCSLANVNVYSMDIKTSFKPSWKYCFCIRGEKFGWITAMRMHKYGQTLRDNYEAYNAKIGLGDPKSRSKESPDEIEISASTAEVQGAEGGVGVDGGEADTVDVYEGKCTRSLEDALNDCKIIGGGVLSGLSNAIHLSQPWFHAGLSDQACEVVLPDFNRIAGVFLVRDTTPAEEEYALTLSYTDSRKLHHVDIELVDEKGEKISDEKDPEHVYYSLRVSDRKIFYDVLQLIEYYSLHTGGLECRLVNYYGPPHDNP